MFQSFKPKLKMSVSHGKSSKTRKLPTLEPLGGERNKPQKIFCIEKDWRKNFEFRVPETNLLPTGELPTCF